jgi:hypothetical protein
MRAGVVGHIIGTVNTIDREWRESFKQKLARLALRKLGR